MAYAYNGVFSKEIPAIAMEGNSAFTYGDSFFETMRWHKGQVMFGAQHWERIQYTCDILHYPLPFSHQEAFIGAMQQLAEMNPDPQQLIRLQVWRNSTRGYSVEPKSLHWMANSSPLTDNPYELNEKGLSLATYTNHLKSTSALSTVKSGSSQLLVMATLFAQTHQLDDVIIFNTLHRPIETTRSNIYLVKGNDIITPPLAEGCLNGIMRKVISQMISSSQNWIEAPISPEMLSSAEECFISSSIRGIQWVRQIDQTSFTINETATYLSKKLQELLS